MKAKQFLPNQDALLSQIRTQRREQVIKRLCRNSYGQDPIAEAIKTDNLKEYRRTKAEEQEARNRRTKARREAREAEEEAQERKPDQEATNQVLYYIGNYYKVTGQLIAQAIRQAEAQAEPEEEAEAGTPTGEIRKLSNKDFITLYYSNRLRIGEENPREKDPEDKLEENQVIKHLKHLNPQVKLTERIRRPTAELYSIRYTTDQANTPEALKYLLSFKGEADTVTNTQLNELQAVRPILSYNFIGYEPNEIVIIGRKADIRGIKKQFNRMNMPENSFYNFIGEKNPNRRIKRTQEKEAENPTFKTIRGHRNPIERERHLNRLRRPTSPQFKEYQKADTAGKAAMINHCLYYTIGILQIQDPEIKTKVIGLNNIRKNEEEVTKALREPKANKHQETAEAVQEAIEEAQATDGRQSRQNIEHDLRQTLKHFKTETSTALYFIIQGVEDRTEEKEKGKPVLNQKKLTALLNVLNSFKSSKELEEEKTDYLTEQLEEANGKDRTIKFKANKKSKNLYNNKVGIQRPNKNPQKCRPEKRATAEEVEEMKRQRKQHETANKRNTEADTLKEYRKEQHKNRQEYTTARRIRQQAHQRHRLREEEKAVIRSYYGERTPQEEAMLIQDHKADNSFKTALQIVIEESKANIKRKYTKY